MINSLFLLSILSLILVIYYLSSYSAWANSPILEHQGIPNTSQEPTPRTNDPSDPVTLHNGRTIFFKRATTTTDCRIDQIPIPRLTSVSYFSDGRILNTTFWLSSPPLDPSHSENLFVNTTNIDQGLLLIMVSDATVTDVRVFNQKEENRSLEDLIRYENKFLEGIGFDNLKSINVTITKVDNNPAYKLIFTGKPQTRTVLGYSQITMMDIITIKDNLIYRIMYVQESDRFFNKLQLIHKMVDSFQIINDKDLINPNQKSELEYNVSPSDNQTEQFKTYINHALGIKISYPQSWGHTLSRNNESSEVMFFSPIRGPYLLLYDYMIGFNIPVFSYDQSVDYTAKLIWIDDIEDPTFSNDSANTVSWGRVVQEFPDIADPRVIYNGDPRVIYKTLDNGKSFKKGENYVLLPLDLSAINYPRQYTMIFGSEVSFVKDGIKCTFIDVINPVASPPPIISVLPQLNLTSIGPNEEKIIELRVKSSSNIPTSVSLNIPSNELVDARIIPDQLTLSSAGWAATYLFLKAKFDYRDSIDMPASIPKTLPITANIDFSKNIHHYLSNTEYIVTGKGYEISKPDIAAVTVTLMNLKEYIIHYLSSLNVLVPLAGLVGAGIAWLLKTSIGKRQG